MSGAEISTGVIPMKTTATALLGVGVLCIAAAVAAQQQVPQLPAPTAARPNPGSVVPKPANAKLNVPQGFTVDNYAENVPQARLMVWAPNGDLFVSQPRANSISVFRDTNKDGLPEERSVFVQGVAIPARGAPRGTPAPSPGTLNQPFGLAFQNGYLYVGSTDSVLRYKYTPGDLKAQGEPQKLADLSGGGNHPFRDVLFSQDGRKMYVSVGSSNNIDETGAGNERRAAIHEYNPDGTGFRLFATGLRNPSCLTWQPGANTLWTAVNERDGLGDELVPDYATSVKDGGFYGWPFSYIGNHVDTRVTNQKADLVARAIVPDILVPAHSAALGLTFYTGTQFPARYRNGLFVALHGSWNRSTTQGVKVVFVPFANNKPSGPIEDFLTGFVVDPAANSKWGRPVGVTMTPDGSLLVSSDDGSQGIFRIRYTGAR
jgi:glucose/arabinose dehydrogenase